MESLVDKVYKISYILKGKIHLYICLQMLSYDCLQYYLVISCFVTVISFVVYLNSIVYLFFCHHEFLILVIKTKTMVTNINDVIEYVTNNDLSDLVNFKDEDKIDVMINQQTTSK